MGNRNRRRERKPQSAAARLRDGTPVENTGRAYLRNVAIEVAIYWLS